MLVAVVEHIPSPSAYLFEVLDNEASDTPYARVEYPPRLSGQQRVHSFVDVLRADAKPHLLASFPE